MRAVVTGARGQVGVELVRNAPPHIEVVGLSRAECDITRPSDLNAVLARHKPDVVVNAAAYTAVDAAEDDRDLAYDVNATGAANVAAACARADARLIHISTDYIFDGAQRTAYLPESSPNPLNVYGKSKLAGEEAVQKAAKDFLIVRSGWIYASHGRNFLLTILSALRAGRPLKVVNDQVGVPTAARSLARAVWACAMQPGIRGIRHWVDRGTASWYDFAVEIQRIATELSLIAESPQITPVTSVEYERPARRPAYSVLDAEMLWRELGAPATWQSELRQTLSELFSGTA